MVIMVLCCITTANNIIHKKNINYFTFTIWVLHEYVTLIWKLQRLFNRLGEVLLWKGATEDASRPLASLWALAPGWPCQLQRGTVAAPLLWAVPSEKRRLEEKPQQLNYQRRHKHGACLRRQLQMKVWRRSGRQSFTGVFCEVAFFSARRPGLTRFH